MLPYYQSLDLELDTNDWRFLNYLSHQYLASVEPLTVGDYKITQYMDFFLTKSPNDYRSHPIFKKISNLFSSEFAYGSLDHVYDNSQISLVSNRLPMHRDFRKCAITIPLLPITTPIIWCDADGNEMMSYTYTSAATLINTEMSHGSPDNQQRRIFFQIGGFKEDNIEKVCSYL
jgi:hypothetical protein